MRDRALQIADVGEDELASVKAVNDPPLGNG